MSSATSTASTTQNRAQGGATGQLGLGWVSPPPPAIWHQTGFTSEAEAVEVQRHGYPTSTSFYAVRGRFGDIPAAPKPARVTWIRCPGPFRLAPAGAPPPKAFG